MTNQAVFLFGYQPKQIKAVEALAAKHSSPSDILRLGPGIHAGQIRYALVFCETAPIDPRSRAKTVVLNMEGIALSAQNALLRVLEEPPKTAMFVLTKLTVHGILPTILSRCRVLECKFPGYSKSLKDLTMRGMDMREAAYVAGLAEQGYYIEEAPSEQDFLNANALVNAGRSGDIELGVTLAGSFTIQTMTALKRVLVRCCEFGALIEAYQTSNPTDTAVLALNELMAGRYGN